jgi:23S rRNA (uridine2552-2'-O)-methyltransferase
LARDRAVELLEPGGTFVCKVFDGQDAHAWVQSLRPHFETVRRLKPEATRRTSKEFFVLASGFRPLGEE